MTNNPFEKESLIFIDFDRTLCYYDKTMGRAEILGQPIPEMANRVKKWIAQGKEVVIFTARVHPINKRHKELGEKISNWCLEHLGKKLEVTCMKHPNMDFLIDDKAISILPNTGKVGSVIDIDEI